MVTPEEIVDAVMDCAREILRKRRPHSSFDLDRAMGADGYMFDDWAKLRSLAEEIADCCAVRLNIPGGDIRLPSSYPPIPILDGALEDLCNDLAQRLLG